MACRDALPAPKVLLMESNRDEREMYAEYLRLNELDILEPRDTAHALQLAGVADVVVTALRLRGSLDGFDLVRRLRTDDRTRHKAVIVLTACASDSDRARAQEAGCDLFLAKPCLPDALLGAIRRVLSRSSVSSVAAGA